MKYSRIGINIYETLSLGFKCRRLFPASIISNLPSPTMLHFCFAQIILAIIWTNPFCNYEKKTFCNLEKYILCFGEIHLHSTNMRYSHPHWCCIFGSKFWSCLYRWNLNQHFRICFVTDSHIWYFITHGQLDNLLFWVSE